MGSTSGISRTRATNLTGLIDIDALVEANLIRQKTKLNTATQKMKIEQYKQEQYREIQSKAKTFYNKYFDVLSGDSLFNAKTYNVMKATSTNDANVTATASTTAEAGNYSVTVNKAAQAAKYQMTESDLLSNTKIAINNEIYDLSGSNAKERAANLQRQLTEKGANVEAKYSQFVNGGNGGLIIQTTNTGADAELSIFLGAGNVNSAFVDKSIEDSGKNAVSDNLLDDTTDFFANIAGGADWDSLKNGSYFSINEKGIKISNAALVEMSNGAHTADEKLLILKDALNQGIADNDDLRGKYTAKVKDGNIIFETVNNEQAFTCKVNGSDKTVTAGSAAKSDVIDIDSIIGGTSHDLIINGETINFDRTAADKRQELKNVLDAKGYTLNDDNTIVSKSRSGAGSNFECKVRNNANHITELDSGTSAENGLGKVIKGCNADVVIKDLDTGLTYNHTNAASNEIELDGVTFKVDRNAAEGSTTNIKVKADGTELKDKIVEFINDYNDLLGSINTKLYEKYDRNYLPLTDDDKEGLSDKEIEKLENKAKTGLLRNDSFLSNFADDMKLTMASVMKEEWGGSSVGLSLEKIGIKPVQDYKSRNGLFTVDEDTLLKAIEDNIDGVKELFTRGSGNLNSQESDGIITKLKNNLYEHATGTFSRLANRAGVADGFTANTNEMTKDIDNRKKQIALMEQALKDKENALYSKYSRLESSLSALQSQQSSLASYFQ